MWEGIDKLTNKLTARRSSTQATGFLEAEQILYYLRVFSSSFFFTCVLCKFVLLLNTIPIVGAGLEDGATRKGKKTFLTYFYVQETIRYFYWDMLYFAELKACVRARVCRVSIQNTGENLRLVSLYTFPYVQKKLYLEKSRLTNVRGKIGRGAGSR